MSYTARHSDVDQGKAGFHRDDDDRRDDGVS